MRRGHEFRKLGFRSTGNEKRRLETRDPEGTHRHMVGADVVSGRGGRRCDGENGEGGDSG